MARFQKATRHKLKLRAALLGPAGSGKTYSALAIAMGLPGPVAVIDTEHGSARKYAGDKLADGTELAFDVLELESFAPATYVDALRDAVAEGYQTIIVDSLTHAWSGKDGALEQVDRAAKRNQGNSFAGWRDVTPQHNALVEAMLRCDAHLIVTMRVKTEYVVEVGANGKSAPKKIGLAPVQRDGLEYEFDVTGDLDLENNFMVGKTRCSPLKGRIIERPGLALAAELLGWLEKGAEAPATSSSSPAAAAPANITPELVAAYKALSEQIAGCQRKGTVEESELLRSELRDAGLPEGLRKPLAAQFQEMRRVVLKRAADAKAAAEVPS